MIVDQANAANVIPILPMHFFELVHDISMFLILDDKHDIGRTVYYNRSDHWYHGKNNVHHPSPWHHYQIGIMGLLVSQIGSIISKGMEMVGDYRKIEGGDLSGIDKDIIDLVEMDNVVPLDEYQDEVRTITPVDLKDQIKTLTNHQKSFQKSSLKVPKPIYLPVRTS